MVHRRHMNEFPGQTRELGTTTSRRTFKPPPGQVKLAPVMGRAREVQEILRKNFPKEPITYGSPIENLRRTIAHGNEELALAREGKLSFKIKFEAEFKLPSPR
jgi:hypothetical protein